MTDVQWFIQVGDGKKAGPVSFEKLQQLAEKKKFFPTTKIRSTEEGSVWIAANTLPGLFDAENLESEPAEKPLPSIFGSVAPTTDDSAAPAAQPDDSGSTLVSINVGDGSSSAATVNVSPFTINRKGGSGSKGLVDVKGKGKKDAKPSDKSTAPSEKKPSGGFFGFGGSKKKDESSVAVANKPAEKDASTARKISIGGSSDGSTARKITIGAHAEEKSTGFPKISIDAKESKPESDIDAISTEPAAESAEKQATEAVSPFFADSESTFDDQETSVDETSESPAETKTKPALYGRSKAEEPSAESASAVVQQGNSVPVWLLVVMTVVLSLALIVNGVFVYLAAMKIENAVAGLEKMSAAKTVKTVKETPKATEAEE